MSVYKDLEKRKEYQREWARKKTIQNKTISPKGESSTEATYCLLFSKLRKIREEHNLSDFSYWMMDIRGMNKDFMCRYGRYENRPIVEIVKPIVKRLILRIVEYVVEKTEPIVEIVEIVEIAEPIVEIVEITEPIVEITEPIVEIVEITEPIVEIVEPIVEIIMASYFNCEECKFKMKRTEYNKYHTKCIDCFYPHRIRSKCFIILD
jgi:hypothetical protein